MRPAEGCLDIPAKAGLSESERLRASASKVRAKRHASSSSGANQVGESLEGLGGQARATCSEVTANSGDFKFKGQRGAEYGSQAV